MKSECEKFHPVGAEIRAQHRTGTPFEQPDLRAAVSAKDADDVVPRRRHHALAVGVKLASSPNRHAL
jgi:hypothetical protein